MSATMNQPDNLTLQAATAADLMKPNPVSIRENASVKEALALLTDKGFSAAPVIDEAGRPVGVISQSDLLIYEREHVDYVSPPSEFYAEGELEDLAIDPEREGFQVESVDRAIVGDIMTPAVFSVIPTTPARAVVSQLLALNVHRLFVVDTDGVLVGVISTIDILRNLQ